MTKFIISATLNQDKNLILQNIPQQNQGENNCSAVEISLPNSMASGNDFYLEFCCPKNKRYVSDKLTATASGSEKQKLYCELPSCVLQEEGFVQMQLVARSATDSSVVYKSNFSNKTSFFVHASVNATQLFSVMDYFDKVDEALAKVQAEAAELLRLKNIVEQHFGDTEALISQKTQEAIAAEREARLAAMTAEQNARISADNTEKSAREAADNAEQTARTAAVAEEATARQEADSALQTGIATHVTDVQNPHGVTKNQVGLGNVRNERQYSAENPNLAETLPLKDGEASAGSATTYSRSDHVHPRDTTKANENEVVKFTDQSLTSWQQAAARKNIGAGTSNFSGNYNDLTNKPTLNGEAIVLSYGDSRVVSVDAFTDVEIMAGYGRGRAEFTFDPVKTDAEIEMFNECSYWYVPVTTSCVRGIIETQSYYGNVHMDIYLYNADDDLEDEISFDIEEGTAGHVVTMNCYFYNYSGTITVKMNNIYAEAVHG